MKVLLHYFSGTGNTRRAAQLLASWYESGGETAELHAIEDGPGDGVADLHFFLSPVYAMGLPGIMSRYLSRMPKVTAVKAAVVTVYGEVNARHTIPGHPGYSPWQAEQILRTRGYDVVWTDALGYPENLTSVANPPSEEDITTINTDSDHRLQEIFTALRKGKRHLIMPRPWVFPVSIPFSGIFQLIGRRILGKLWAADCRCNGCAVCVRVCPAKTIRLQGGRPKWGLSCEGCQRCYNLCPQQAIQLSLVRAAAVLIPWGALAGLLAAATGFTSKKRNPIIFRVFTSLVGALLTLIAWNLLDRLGRIPKYGRLSRINYSRFLRRYTARPIDR